MNEFLEGTERKVDTKLSLTPSFPPPISLVHWLRFPSRMIPLCMKGKKLSSSSRCSARVFGMCFLCHGLWDSTVQHKPTFQVYCQEWKTCRCLLHFSGSLLQRGESLLVRHSWLQPLPILEGLQKPRQDKPE